MDPVSVFIQTFERSRSLVRAGQLRLPHGLQWAVDF
jgi:hypothetical protein